MGLTLRFKIKKQELHPKWSELHPKWSSRESSPPELQKEVKLLDFKDVPLPLWLSRH